MNKKYNLNKETFTLKEISSWPFDNIVSLPTLQRGFVWKTSQIENLWDSILRGYPIGSFVLSPLSKDFTRFELLDGQQRATSIALGFLDPFLENHSAFNAKDIMIFIDLEKPSDILDSRKYIFRVITRSHPWGYRRSDNTKTLESHKIKKAQDRYGLKDDDYFKKPLNEFWPYDAGCPVPLSFFIEACLSKAVEAREILELKITNWKEEKNINDTKDNYSIDEIFKQVQKILFKQRVPSLYHEIDENDSGSNVSDEANEIDEMENLFVRLNSAGTPLRGEELNYSILKASLNNSDDSKQLIKSIEKHCCGLIRPSRFITISYRLYQHFISDDKKKIPALSMRVKSKEFQRMIRSDDANRFTEFIKNESFPLLDKVKDFLIFDEESNFFGLPPLLVTQMCEHAPEVIFIVFYRFLLKGDVFEKKSDLRKKALGLITLFSWFGKGNKLKNHEPLLNNLGPFLNNDSADHFWSSDLVARAKININENAVLVPVMSDALTKELVRKLVVDNEKVITNGKIGNLSAKENFFVRKVFFEKSLILYAQRFALNRFFPGNYIWELEDTNVPFDWDHISPYSLAKNNKEMKQSLRDWYGSNGNYRAWPYYLNRMDQDDSPAIKLKPQEKGSNLENPIKDSFCTPAWLGHTFVKSEMKNSSNQKIVYKLILERNRDIYNHWWKELNIGSLIPSEPPKNKYEIIKSFFKRDSFQLIEGEDMFCIDIDNGELKIVFYFEGENPAECMREDMIEIGIWEPVNKVLLKSKNLDLGSSYSIVESMADGDILSFNFTLLSYSVDSHVYLLKEFLEWVRGISNDKFKNSILDAFKAALKKEYQNILRI